MKNNIELIEFINQYINKELSETDRQVFESNLKTDSAFNELYQEQLTFIEGLKRAQLIAEINTAKSNYVKAKWLKHIGLSALIVGFSVLCYSLLFESKKKNTKPFLPIENVSVITTDSITKKYTIIHKKDTILEDKEKTKAYGVNAFKEITLTKYSGQLTLKEFEQKFPNYRHFNPVNDSIIIHKRIDYNHKIEDHAIIAKTSKKNPISTKAFYNSIKKTPEVIVFNSERDTTIICKEGTKLKLKAKSFIDSNTKKPIVGTISLNVTEYYKLSDMLLANLSTKSDDKILETGGMIHLEAFKNGKALKLKEDEKIDIAFPKTKNKKGMQLFLGEKNEQGINWNIPKQEDIIVTIGGPSEGVVEVAYNVVETVPVFPGCEKGDNNDKKKCMTEKMKKFINKKFNTGIAEELKLLGKHKISVFFKIDTNGEVVNAVAQASHIKLAEEAIRLVDLLPKMKPATQKGVAVIVPYYLPIHFSVGKSTRRNFSNDFSAKSNKNFNNRFKKRVDSLGVKNVPLKDISRYAFSSSSLGWINCDRFVKMKNRKRFKLNIKDSEDAKITLIFKSISAILSSENNFNDYDFGWVPAKEEEVVLVSIKTNENGLYLGIKERKTSYLSDLNFSYKTVSIDELKEELTALNTLF